MVRLRAGSKGRRAEENAGEEQQQGVDASADQTAKGGDAVAVASRSAGGSSPASRTKLGELLVERGIVTRDQLSQALLEQATSGERLGATLVQQGNLDESALLQALSEQLKLPLIDLRRTLPTQEALVALPGALVWATQALPMRVAGRGLAVAMAGPPTPEVLASLEDAAGTRVSVVLAPGSDIRRLIEESYPSIPATEPIIESQPSEPELTTEAAAVAASLAITLTIAEDSPAEQVVTTILSAAVGARATDVHIDPQDDELYIRFRVDGALRDATALALDMAPALVTQLETMARMDVEGSRLRQDGRFEAQVDEHSLDVRVAISATMWGTKVVLRMHDGRRDVPDLDRLGMSTQTRSEFADLIRTPSGMVLCAGPLRSGRTTTLYAALSEIDAVSRSVVTIENAVEYILPRVDHIQTEGADVTFADGLRVVLLQDPDVILVGEIGDVETARLAMQSALSGHLVLGSLYAADSTVALRRFLDMGAEPFLVASSMVGVVAQRLLRRMCPHCREPYTPSSEELRFYEDSGGTANELFLHGTGCDECSNSGYMQRVGIYELLHVSNGLKHLIVNGATYDDMRALAIEEGMRTLRHEALRLIEDDVTTIAEVIRTIHAV